MNNYDKASIFLACVGAEVAFNTTIEWSGVASPNGRPNPRFSCNLGDIIVDIAIIGAIASVTINAIIYLTGGPDDGIISTIFAGGSGYILIENLINLSSPAFPYIVGVAIIGSILKNCWEVIADFFVDVFTGIRDFFLNLFGNGIDCDDPNNITAQAPEGDCAGNVIVFTAHGAGDDIVAYEWNNTGTDPEIIQTQFRTFSFGTTAENVTIRVTAICSDGDTGVEYSENFNVDDVVENDPVTVAQFIDWPTNMTTNVTYRFYITAGAGLNETLTFSGGTGVTIVQSGPSWVDVSFQFGGTKSVTATITDDCTSDFTTDTEQVFIN